MPPCSCVELMLPFSFDREVRLIVLAPLAVSCFDGPCSVNQDYQYRWTTRGQRGKIFLLPQTSFITLRVAPCSYPARVPLFALRKPRNHNPEAI